MILTCRNDKRCFVDSVERDKYTKIDIFDKIRQYDISIYADISSSAVYIKHKKSTDLIDNLVQNDSFYDLIVQ